MQKIQQKSIKTSIVLSALLELMKTKDATTETSDAEIIYSILQGSWKKNLKRDKVL
jgi:hypothetical protein